MYGKCNHPYGHGHNYMVEVMVSGDIDPVTGMVCNLGDLDGFMQREVVEHFNLENLNTDRSFAGQVPTTENLCMEIHRRVRLGFSQANLERVRVEETASNSFEFAG